MSIALCVNVFQDAAALRGLLEEGSRFFDNVFIIHSGPNGAYSTDGTIELVKSFGCKLEFDDISKGFGVIRTRLLRECECDWGFILDADERFHPQLPVLYCEGSPGSEQNAVPRLLVDGTPIPPMIVRQSQDIFNQGSILREIISTGAVDAVRMTRRHWWDFTMKHPTQNFVENLDHQLRCVRNDPHIFYRSERKMHEQLVDSRIDRDPRFYVQDPHFGPYIDHYHLHFRREQPGRKDFNEKNYGRIDRGEPLEVPK